MIIRHRNYKGLFLLIICILMVGLVALTSCISPAPTPTPTPTPAPTPQALGKTIVVASTADSGSGTLRQALLDAQSGDSITFDPAVFPPSAPAIIYLSSELPHITQDNLLIDASNAGVILDGSNILEDGISGLEIHSNGNTIRGLQIINFSPGAGIVLSGGAQNNMIGGDRSVGSGPLGQGNLVSNGDVGIGLWDGASFNTVTGNLIGTDATGTEAWGNDGAGVAITDGASRNIISPDNIIAYNEDGVAVLGSNSFGNTITQNSIHDNRHQGIYLHEGGNTELSAPLIFNFNLAAGTITGAASANSIVEIFSDSNDEGEIYEGQARTDDTGTFTFNKGASFTGPRLTATVTDSDGNSSMFSARTTGTGKSLVLQTGNNQPKTKLKHKESRELVDNRIGGVWDGFWAVDMDRIIDTEILPVGLKRVRLAINSVGWEAINWDKPEFTIDAKDDEAITRIANNGITITYVLTFWDKASYPEGKGIPCPRFKTEKEIQRYHKFVRFIARHFKDRIKYYDLWGEPDITDPCFQGIEVDDYIELVKRTVPVIREECPDAKIVVGSTMPQVEPGSREYLLTILTSDIMPLVDVIAWHPGGPSPEYEWWRENYHSYPSLVQEIKDLASSHGFKGEYTADEMVWWTPAEFPSFEPWTYSDTKAAKYYARFVIIHLGMDVAEQGGVASLRPASLRLIQNLCTIMAGNKPISLPVEIESQATNIMSYTFSLPNGDKLLALWTHGVAVDNDPGIEATLTLPGFSAQKVVGIDVLNGFEQQMVTNVEDGNLVIRNLLVKDYPIILRLTD